ncbi:MAG: hypothetical protein ACK42C_00090 [Aquificaceae bacterium]
MRYLEISKEGKVRTFKGDFPEVEKELKGKKYQRLSYVAPVGWAGLWIALRVLSEKLRLGFLERALKSVKGKWVVFVDGKPIGIFDDRQKALEFEKQYFVRRFKHECKGARSN